MLVHAALCLLSMCVAPGCISLSAWVTCVLHPHLLSLLVLEAHLPQIHSPGVSWATSSGPSELWRERLLSSVFLSRLTDPKPNSSWNYTLLEKSLPVLMNSLPSSLLFGLEVKVKASRIPRWTQSFSTLNLMEPGEAVPFPSISLPQPFSIPPPSLPYTLFSYVRFSAYFRNWCRAACG